MPADLHTHTLFSDGTETPEKIVELAKQAGLTSIAITDHDVVAGIDRAIKRGQELGVEVIPGIEFTTEDLNAEIHIVGCFIDYKDLKLLEIIKKMQKARKDRIYKICEKLKAINVNLDPAEVFKIAGHEAAGRPHVAKALMKQGSVSNFKEAFNRYIAFNGPAYVSHYKLSPAEAIKLVLDARGLPIFAHPAVSHCDQIIPDLKKAGLVGIEAHYISHSQSQTEHYLKLAEKYGLLVSGGSDYHGEGSGREIKPGDVSISDELMDKLRNEYLRRNKS